MHFVYVLRCSDGLNYTGCTENLEERINRHQKGQVPATIGRLPAQLVFYCAFQDKYKAFDFERYLKSGSGRAFMQKRFFKEYYRP